MNVLIATMGLPRSGKSTWAKEFSKAHGFPMVNPDSIRLALTGLPFVPEAERFVWATARVMVDALFLAGHATVILDATNTTRKRRDEWKSKFWKTQFQVFDTKAETCRERAGDNASLIAAIDRMAAAWEPLEENEL
jgi:predicted kinase